MKAQKAKGYTLSIQAKKNGKVEWSAKFDNGETTAEMDPEAAIEASKLLEECAQLAKAKEFDNAE